MCWWGSQGKKLGRRAVAVEARRVAARVFAIVQPVEPVRQKPKRPEPNSPTKTGGVELERGPTAES